MKTTFKKAITLLILSLGIGVLGSQRVRFPPVYVINDISNISDSSPDTCITFPEDDDTKTRDGATLRVQTPDGDYEYLYVSLIGSNLGCGRSLFVIPLTRPQTLDWTGIWRTCDMTSKYQREEKGLCSFLCHCLGGCEEIQITKRPREDEQRSWSLCDIAITSVPGDCSEVISDRDGVYNIIMSPAENTAQVYCNMSTIGPGWTVILRRQDGSVDFNRNWQDYKDGFGFLNGEFWAGNELVHQLTTRGRTYSLRVDLTNYRGEHIFAHYSEFSLGAESDNYLLHVAGYLQNSTAGDSLKNHNNMMFSTASRDNDYYSTSCAEKFNAPWWYNKCHSVLLTGHYGEYPTIKENQGIRWSNPWGSRTFAQKAVMMIKPVK